MFIGNPEVYNGHSQCDLVVQISNLPLLVRFFIGFWNCSDDVTFFLILNGLIIDGFNAFNKRLRTALDQDILDQSYNNNSKLICTKNK